MIGRGGRGRGGVFYLVGGRTHTLCQSGKSREGEGKEGGRSIRKDKFEKDGDAPFALPEKLTMTKERGGGGVRRVSAFSTGNGGRICESFSSWLEKESCSFLAGSGGRGERGEV